MKKILTISISLVLLLGITFSIKKVYSLEKENSAIETKLTEAKASYPNIYNYLNSITYNQFKTDVASGKEFYVYVGRPTCGDCNSFEPKFIELIQQYQLNNKVVYVNVAELKEDETNWELFKSTYDVQYTPTIAKFVNGKLQEKVEWTPEMGIDIEDVESWVRTNLK